MTTTAFRIDSGGVARMGSDSRVSWVTPEGLVAKVSDSPDYYKVANINGVLYGFAGTNLIYKVFLQHYHAAINHSNQVLDALVAIAKQRRVEFAMLRFDGELREFAYSPPDENDENEIFIDSQSKALNTKIYAIGSGKSSRMYKKGKINQMVCFPIRRIIRANTKALAGSKYAKVRAKLNGNPLSDKEAVTVVNACWKAGGDVFTGGEVRVMESSTNVTTATMAANQVQILDDLDSQAKSQGLTCASPIYADKEISQLLSLGVSPVREGEIDPALEKSEIFKSISDAVDVSL